MYVCPCTLNTHIMEDPLKTVKLLFHDLCCKPQLCSELQRGKEEDKKMKNFTCYLKTFNVSKVN
jgi:hypothetical protein